MIAFIGISGSGKTTQAHILAKKLDCQVVTTGKVLKKQLTGQLAMDVKAGKIVDDKTTIELLERELIRLKAGKNEVILDGSPRSIDQGRWLAESFKSGKFKFTAFIHLKVSESVVYDRLIKRQRDDDTDESIQTRFNEYHIRVKPVLEYLRGEGFVIHEVDGEGPVEQDAKRIEQALGL